MHVKNAVFASVSTFVVSLALVAVLGVGDALAAPKADDVDFTIVSYNIKRGRGMDGKRDLTRTGGVIAREKPRFVGVQEIDMNRPGMKNPDSCGILEKVTGLHATFSKAIDLAGEYGVAALSKEKPLGVKRLLFPGGKEQRTFVILELEDCWFGTTHLGRNRKKREASIDEIEKLVKECAAKKPVFICGDWNSTPASPTLEHIRKFATILSPTDASTISACIKDEKGPNHKHCIDYIAVDNAHAAQFEAVNPRVIQDDVTSDHMPVAVGIRRRK